VSAPLQTRVGVEVAADIVTVSAALTLPFTGAVVAAVFDAFSQLAYEALCAGNRIAQVQAIVLVVLPAHPVGRAAHIADTVAFLFALGNTVVHALAVSVAHGSIGTGGVPTPLQAGIGVEVATDVVAVAAALTLPFTGAVVCAVLDAFAQLAYEALCAGNRIAQVQAVVLVVLPAQSSTHTPSPSQT
jgi:uncharacterized protein with GYD domain